MYKILHIPTGKYYWRIVNSADGWLFLTNLITCNWSDHVGVGLDNSQQWLVFVNADDARCIMAARPYHFELIEVDDV